MRLIGTMQIKEWVLAARREGASDLHLEPRLPVSIRTRGTLKLNGPAVSPEVLLEEARALLSEEGWADLVERGSADLSRTIGGVRCRINVLRSARGVGLAIRLLPTNEPTLAGLNLHPGLEQIVRADHGLVVVSGPTGCGKSSTIAALIQAINQRDPKHIITIEEPIEYTLRSRRSLVRQRQVGRDTPSFSRALRDALREDPDVLVVGEMRDSETMRLTLDAAETGHLVLTTIHSSTTSDALQRLIGSHAPEHQPAIQAQVAEVLRAAVCQRLRWRPDLGIRVPECEVLWGSSGVRNVIRNGHFHKLGALLETGVGDGMWTFERYAHWLEERMDWTLPEELPSASNGTGYEGEDPPQLQATNGGPPPSDQKKLSKDAPVESGTPVVGEEADGPIVLQAPGESMEDILSQIDRL